MKSNSILLVLGRIHSDPVNHEVRMFKVTIYNSLDMLPHVNGENNSDDIKGYRETEELEDILNNLRNHIKICYHGQGITETILEDDSI